MTDVHLDKGKNSGRERLIQAAHTLAQAQSFDEITIDEIVKAAALSRPAFYYHFTGGKEELRTELVRRGALSDEPAQDTRQVIMEAALRVFARSGVTAATLEDIASDAGVSRGTLSWHFRSKDDLLAAIIEQHHITSPLRQVIDDIEQDIRNNVPLTDELILKRIAGAFYDAFVAKSDMARLPIMLLYSHPDAAQFLANKIVRGRKGIVEYVQRRQEDGVFCPNIDAAFFVHIMAIAFVMKAVCRNLTDLLPFGHLTREEYIDQLVTLLLHGMLKSDRAENDTTEA